MAVAGNQGGAGGARNVARAQRKPKPPPSPASYYVSQGKAVEKAANTQRLARSLPKGAPALDQRAQRARTSRVAVSANRRRTGGAAPIIVRRRQDVARQQRGLQALQRAGEREGVLVKPPPPPKPKAKRPGGVIGTGLAAASLADKILSGKKTAGLVAGASDIAGKVAEQAVTGDFYLNKLGLKAPKGGAAGRVRTLARGIGHDVVDLPANFIPSVYNPSKETVKAGAKLAKGDIKGAGETEYKGAIKPLAKGALEVVEHPTRHPIGAALTVTGVGGAIGRGAGFAARTGALGEAAAGAAKTAREAKTIPGTRAESQRPYSPDVIRKGAQVGREKLAERNAAKKGQRSSKRQMQTRDIQREVNDFVRVQRNVRGVAEERVTKEVGQALGHTKLRKPQPTAHHTVAVQGLTNATKADLQRLLAETEQAAQHLGGDRLRQNRRRAEELRKAIRAHDDGTEAHVRQTQVGYRKIDKRQEDEMAALGIIDPAKADVARYTHPATRLGLHDPEAAPAHRLMAKERKQQATKEKGKAFQARKDANANLDTVVAQTRVAELGPRGKRHPDVTRAERDHRDAQKALADTHAKLDKRVADAEAELTAARHDAAISSQHVSQTPAVKAAYQDLVNARRDLADLERQHQGMQRAGGRLEGRAQERVTQANAAARGRTRAAAADVKRSAKEVNDHAAALRALEDGGGTPKQIEAARRRLDKAEARHEANVRERNASQTFQPGTQPAGMLGRVERHGATELDLGQQIGRARDRVKAAELNAAKVQQRFKGVPPDKADRLRRAIIGQAEARLAKRNREGVHDAEDRVTQAKARVAYEKSKRGLEPAAADRLWKAMGEAESATMRHRQAVADEAAAAAHHRDMRAAPFVDRQGNPSSIEDVRSHPAMSGQPEPSFVSGAPEQRVGAVPTGRVNIPNPQGRSGAMVAEGRSPVSGAHLLNTRIARERLIQAAHARNEFIDHFGFREGGDPKAELATAPTEGAAAKLAEDAEKTTGVAMSPIHNQDDTWSVVPRDALKQLEAHEKMPAWADPIERLGRQWRQGVLAFSTKWLTGQAGEGALRLAIHQGFNPVRLGRSLRMVARTEGELRKMAEAGNPDAARALQNFETLYKRGGAGRTARQNRQEAFHDFQMGEDSGRLMALLHALQRTKSARVAGGAYGAWQKLMFDWANGTIETAVRKGMVGRELLADPIFRDKGIVTNFQQAAEDLANGLTNTAAQNRLARNIDDAFGKYQGRGPAARHVIENVTPFIPWFLSAMRFLGVVLPRDHPVLTTLGVAANQASEEWRKKYGLTRSLSTPVRGSDTELPVWSQGSVPIGGALRNVSHYTPMGAMQSLGDLGSFLLPQYADLQAAAKGEDWRGQPLTGRDSSPSQGRILAAIASAGLETVFPPAGTFTRLAGIHMPNEPNVQPGDEKPSFGKRLKKTLSPLPAQKGIDGGGDSSGLKLAPPLVLKGAAPLKSSGGLVLK